jgi:hypothetical protein
MLIVKLTWIDAYVNMYVHMHISVHMTHTEEFEFVHTFTTYSHVKLKE